jgi:hypothetical protein
VNSRLRLPASVPDRLLIPSGALRDGVADDFLPAASVESRAAEHALAAETLKEAALVAVRGRACPDDALTRRLVDRQAP